LRRAHADATPADRLIVFRDEKSIGTEKEPCDRAKSPRHAGPTFAGSPSPGGAAAGGWTRPLARLDHLVPFPVSGRRPTDAAAPRSFDIKSEAVKRW